MFQSVKKTATHPTSPCPNLSVDVRRLQKGQFELQRAWQTSWEGWWAGRVLGMDNCRSWKMIPSRGDLTEHLKIGAWKTMRPKKTTNRTSPLCSKLGSGRWQWPDNFKVWKNSSIWGWSESQNLSYETLEVYATNAWYNKSYDAWFFVEIFWSPNRDTNKQLDLAKKISQKGVV